LNWPEGRNENRPVDEHALRYSLAGVAAMIGAVAALLTFARTRTWI
jgi:hypothetical protein